MRKTPSILGALVVTFISVGARLAATQFLRTSAVPPIQFTMPTGGPLPKFDGMTTPFPMGGMGPLPSPVTSLETAANLIQATNPPRSMPAPSPTRTIARGESVRPTRRASTRPAEAWNVSRPQSGGPRSIVVRPAQAAPPAGPTGGMR
jgi:hypothetical protein